MIVKSGGQTVMILKCFNSLLKVKWSKEISETEDHFLLNVSFMYHIQDHDIPQLSNLL